ncbi:MAG: hypothetical protein NVSMB68_00660 [Thermoanaerobaculia bacterium]
MRRLFPTLLVFVLTLLPVALFAQSQATTGVIEGIVTDATGGALPGVTVTLRNTETNFLQTVVTDSGGHFHGVLLPLGKYDVTASLEGFSTSVMKGFDLAVGQTLTANFVMKTAAVSEQIVVTAAAPLIETARTEGSTRIDQKSV